MGVQEGEGSVKVPLIFLPRILFSKPGMEKETIGIFHGSFTGTERRGQGTGIWVGGPPPGPASCPNLCPLRRRQQAPGAVRAVQGIELWRRRRQLHVEAETPKHIEGVGGLMVDRRMPVET